MNQSESAQIQDLTVPSDPNFLSWISPNMELHGELPNLPLTPRGQSCAGAREGLMQHHSLQPENPGACEFPSLSDIP